MDPLDDWFEYALDLPAAQRAEAVQVLRAQDPALAARLEAALADQVTNADFACRAAGSSLLAVTLAVGDVPAAVRWYTDVLGARLVRQDAGRAVLSLPPVDLHLVAAGEAPPGLTVAGAGTAALGGAGSSHGGGVRHLIDPWGNAITVVDAGTER